MDLISARISLRYFLSLLPGTLVVAGNLAGGWWTFANMVFTMVLLITFENFSKEKKQAPEITHGIVPDIVLAVHIILHTASVLSLLYGVHSGILTGIFIWVASVSTGISSGIEGINSAHELIHRKQWYARLGGIWNLLLVNYAHFYVEHIRGHHRFIGTSRDPATARYGESFYHFFFRTVPAQFRSALALETERLSKSGKGSLHPQNRILQLILIQLTLCICVFMITGFIGFFAYINQSIVAFFLLEYVNYIEHYGLQRHEWEKVNMTHSWQCDLPISRFALIELSRHSDHHLNASRPYYRLISHEESPVLPSGYFGSFYWALIPPVWFRKVNPVLDAFLENKKSNATNQEKNAEDARYKLNQ